MGHFEKIVVLIAITCVTAILVVTFSEDGEGTLLLSMEDGTPTVSEENTAPQSGDVGFPVDGELVARSQGAPRSQGTQGINPRSREEQRGGPIFTEIEPTQTEPAIDPRTQVPNFDEPIEVATKTAPAGLLERSKLDQEQRDRANKGDLFLDDSFTATGRRTGGELLPMGTALITSEGLRKTFDDEIMEYTWRIGDTMTSVAQQYYGSKDMAALLRQFNEDRSHVPTGDTILVPVFDGRSQSEKSRITLDVPRDELSEEGGTLYTVEEGDSLWEISKKVYGRGTDWNRILEANKDVLKSAELIRTGMELRIP